MSSYNKAKLGKLFDDSVVKIDLCDRIQREVFRTALQHVRDKISAMAVDHEFEESGIIEIIEVNDPSLDVNALLPEEETLIAERVNTSMNKDPSGSSATEASDMSVMHSGIENLPKSRKMAGIADTVLIFVCPSPDDAEAALGDLMERFEQVRARKSWRVSIAYFYWELLLLTVTKAKKRLVGATIGPILKKFFAGSG